MAQHEQPPLFPEPFGPSSFIPPCFSLSLLFSFFSVLLGCMRTSGIFSGSFSETTPVTEAVLQGLHRLMQQGPDACPVMLSQRKRQFAFE